MYYLYFLPKPTHPLLSDQPWGAPQRLGFQNSAFARYYVDQLRQHHHSVVMLKGQPTDTVPGTKKATLDD